MSSSTRSTRPGGNNPQFQNRPFMALAKGNAPVKHSQNVFHNNLPRLSQTDEDGKHHINIGNTAVTELGYYLGLDAEARFSHPEFGSFTNVRGFSHWMKSKSFDDAYRQLNGTRMVAYFRENIDDQQPFVNNYNYHMAQAMWSKIKQNKDLSTSMKDSELPFEMYYRIPMDRHNPEAGYGRARDKNAGWVIPIMNVIRAALKDGEEPNFEQFLYDSETAGDLIQRWKENREARAAANLTPSFIDSKLTQAAVPAVPEAQMPDIDADKVAPVEELIQLPVAGAVLEGLPVDDEQPVAEVAEQA